MNIKSEINIDIQHIAEIYRLINSLPPPPNQKNKGICFQYFLSGLYAPLSSFSKLSPSSPNETQGPVQSVDIGLVRSKRLLSATTRYSWPNLAAALGIFPWI